MTTLMIILFALSVWYFSGFISGRRTDRRRNRYHPWGLFGQVWFWIDGDKRGLPVPGPYPFGPVEVPFYFTRYLEKDAEKNKQGTIKKVPGLNTQIEIVEHKTTRLRKREIHPYLVEMKFPITGLIFFADITAKLEIVEPDKVITLDNVLQNYGIELADAIGPWGAQTEKDWMKEYKTQNPNKQNDEEEKKLYIIEKMLTWRIDDEPGIKIGEEKLLDYMNTTKGFLGTYGIKTLEFGLRVGYDEQVEKLITLKTKILTTDKENKVRDLEREREKADQNQIIELEENRLIKVQVPLLEKIKEVKAAEYSGFQGGTLFAGTPSSSEKLDAVVASVFAGEKGKKEEKTPEEKGGKK